MQKTYTHAVIVGRFQPLHFGHQKLIEHALSIADSVIVVLGSHRSAPSLRNPWNSDTRMAMIRAVFANQAEALSFLPLMDSAYDIQDWLERLVSGVHAIAGLKARIVLVGHEKDVSSQYLQAITKKRHDWNRGFISLQDKGLSASQVRRALFERDIPTLEQSLSPAVFLMLQTWLQNDSGQTLLEEYRQVNAYRAQWSAAPWVPVFVTGDAMLVVQNHVLLIRRGNFPGKGQLALPGGYLEAEESIDACIVRELREETCIDMTDAELQAATVERGVFDRPDRDPRGRIITHAALIMPGLAKFPKTISGDDAAEAFWFPLAELQKRFEEFYSDHALIMTALMKRQNRNG